MAYKKLSDAMSGKPPPPAPKPAAKPTQVITSQVREYAGPKSSVAAREAYAKAMNAGDRAAAAKAKAQMDAEEAAANVVPKITRKP